MIISNVPGTLPRHMFVSTATLKKLEDHECLLVNFISPGQRLNDSLSISELH